MIELAVTEEQFKKWKLADQNKWIREHPNSKFAKQRIAQPIEKINKARDADKKKKLAERKKQADARFMEIMKTKSPKDRKAFIAARKAGVAIPPAWTNVIFYGKPENGKLAEGTDEKGRRQRVEDSNYRITKIREKHEKIQNNLEPKYDGIVRKLRNDLDNPASQVLYLITKSGFRIGDKTDGKAKHTAYGAASLLGKHVKVNGENVTFDFIGKEGVRQIHTIKDKHIAKFVSGKKADEKIFNVSVDKVRERWKDLGGDKVHDIRSLLATRIAKKVVEKNKKPENEKELKLLMKTAAEAASKVLGNRPSEALGTYIFSDVFPNAT